jgi:formylglycine-generating enzyme required for sulfatase activity
MADVYISYHRERRAVAAYLARILEANGYSVWSDFDITADGYFAEQNERQLRAAKAVVVLRCSKSIESNFVLMEALHALKQNTLLPVAVEDVRISSPFNSFNTLDLCKWDGSPTSAPLIRLIDSVAKLTGKSRRPDDTALEVITEDWRRAGSPTIAQALNGAPLMVSEGKEPFRANPKDSEREVDNDPAPASQSSEPDRLPDTPPQVQESLAEPAQKKIADARKAPQTAPAAQSIGQPAGEWWRAAQAVFKGWLAFLARRIDVGPGGWLRRVFLPVMGVYAALAMAVYGLAWLARWDEWPPSAQSVNAVPGIVTASGTPVSAEAIAGHDSPLVSAHGIDGGIVTSAQDGSVRWTNSGAASWLDTRWGTRLGDSIYQDIWRPYGLPVAQVALSIVGRIDPSIYSKSAEELSQPLIGSAFRDCPACPEMIIVPPGKLVTEGTQSQVGRIGRSMQEVTITRAFAVGRFEVTRQEFEKFVEETDYAASGKCATLRSLPIQFRLTEAANWEKPGFTQGLTHPVVCVSWKDAMSFVSWLSEKTGQQYRLLSAIEWQYAAKARTNTKYSFGNNTDRICEFSNGMTQATLTRYPGLPGSPALCEDGFINTAPVGSFKPNSFGLYDMHGNVSEWLQDCNVEIVGEIPLRGQKMKRLDCSNRSVAGGSWFNPPAGQASSGLGSITIEYPFNYIGFRIARSL